MFKKAVAYLPVLLTVIFAVILLATFSYQRMHNITKSTSNTPDNLWVVDGKLNINTVNSAMLRQLPGMEYKMSCKIVEYREKNGPFRDVHELLNVKGFSPDMLEKIIDYITVGDVK